MFGVKESAVSQVSCRFAQVLERDIILLNQIERARISLKL